MTLGAGCVGRRAACGGRASRRWQGTVVGLAIWSVLLTCQMADGAPATPTAPKSPAIRMLVVKSEADARAAIALHAAGTPFERIVSERSIGPERQRGGYLGRVDISSLSRAAQDAVLKTPPGKLTPVFPAEGGYGVIQVLTEREAREEEARLQREPEALALLKEGTDRGTQGDLEGAVRLLRRAVELNPGLADGHFNLAIAQARLGRIDAAIESMNEVVRLQPNDADAHRRLGGWLSGRGRQAEAIAHLEQAAGLEMDSADVWLQLARSYETAGRARAAVGAYRRVLALSGREDAALLSALLKAATEAKDGPAAVEAARRLRTLRTGHEGFLTLADALLLNGEAEAAAREYRMAVGLAPKSARARAGLAAALTALDQTESAVDQLLLAIELEPTNPAHYQRVAALYERTGRRDLAIVALRDGVSATTTAPTGARADMAEELAALYDRADMREEAARERERAQALRSGR